MNNNELLPFSRNRYYKGKLLTSADFEAEQLYMNNKRRFVNQNIIGSGIACGLNVISLDDLSIMIESGVAFDGAGRELVVDSSVVKKLSAISGFEGLTGNNARLCIRYKDQEEQPVYSINRQDSGKEFEYNRIQDSYELFLIDSDLVDAEFEAETEFFTGGVLAENSDYRLSLRFPAYVCTGHYVKLEVLVEKLSEEKSVFSYESILQTPALTTLDGSQELAIKVDNIKLDAGQKITKEYWLLAQSDNCDDTSVMIKSGSAKASINYVDFPVNSGTSYKINVVDLDPEELAAREASRLSFEMRTLGSNTDMIELADISLVRTESAYLIEQVDESVRKYIATTADAWKRLEYTGFFCKKFPFLSQEGAGQLADQLAGDDNKKLYDNPYIATGIVEIPVGDHAKKGDICYSSEIMHGLGSGNVYVEVGYEYLEENETLGRNAKNTIFGNPELFDNGKLRVDAETAVKVYNDKGSFVVALKLKQDVSTLVLTYRWVAIRYGSEKLKDEIDVTNTQSISAVTPTIVLGTRENYFFQVKYNNMKECSISYELTEAGSGEISSDGIYTAPAKEGVYEIRIYCTDRPLICTYAYAVVKRKGKDDAADKQQAPASAPATDAPAADEPSGSQEAGLDIKKGLL